jgi:VanZ family protein
VHLTANPLWILFHSWDAPVDRFFFRDAVVNVALYIPLGFAAHLAFRKSGRPGFSIYGPVLLGSLLSTVMELTQLLAPNRHTSVIDLINNVIGSGIGVMLGLLFEAIAPQGLSRPNRDYVVADRAALLLAFCWVAWLVFPFFPMLRTHDLFRKIIVFEQSPVLDWMRLVSTAATWYAAGLLLEAGGTRFSRKWFAVTLLVIPGQFFIEERQPLLSVLLGAITGFLLCAVCYRGGAPTKTEAWAFLAVIVVRGLSPFHFVTAATEIDWIPFGATLDSEWQSALAIVIEKAFFYGTAVWLLRAAGLTLVRSVIVVATVLASIEIAQTHLPGRTSEITDPIVAVLMGFVLAMPSRPARPVSSTR